MRYDGATFATFAVRRKQNEEFTANKSTSWARAASQKNKNAKERDHLTRKERDIVKKEELFAAK